MDTPTTYASRRWAELAQADEWARLEAMDRRVELMAPTREAITVTSVQAGPGRGTCPECGALIGNYHREGCPR
jgi:hypothetical protein